MHPIRKQRLQIVLLIILAAACASGLVIYMLGQNTNYFIPRPRFSLEKHLREYLFEQEVWL